MKRTIAALVAVLALAGCGSAATTTTHQHHHLKVPLSGKSFKDGMKVGENIAIPNKSDGQIKANCAVSAVEQMPAGDIKSSWMGGCFGGYIMAQIKSDQSNGG